MRPERSSKEFAASVPMIGTDWGDMAIRWCM